jgi:hypothetical protein
VSGVRVTSSLGGLAADLRTIAVEAKPAMVKVVRAAVVEGNTLAQGFARAESGRHGKNYYKRITSEMTGLLSGTYGPTGVVEGNAVGAGWRHGHNTDLARSADIIGPKMAGEALDAVDGLFWPGA